MSKNIAFRVRNLFYEYQLENQAVKILEDINFDIAQGELVAITGSSGSGKSTLLHLLGGVLKCQTSELYVNQQNIADMSEQQLAYMRNYNIGFIFQQFFLLPKINVLDNILLPTFYPIEQILSSEQKEQNITKAKAIADKLGIGKRLYHLPKALSGGEQQRVAVARALMSPAKVIIADEPTGNLDSKNTDLILDIFKQLNKEGYTIIVVTHDDRVARIANKRFYFKDGKIEKISTDTKYNADAANNSYAWKNNFVPSHVKKTSFTTFKSMIKLMPMAWKNVWLDKAKYFANMMGIIIGIANIIAMISLGQFLNEKVITSYSDLGTDVIRIHGYPNWDMSASDNNKMIFESFDVYQDVMTLQRIFPQIHYISAIRGSAHEPVSYKQRALKSGDVQVIGVSSQIFHVNRAKFFKGGGFPTIKNKLNSSCVISYRAFKDLFYNHENPIGETINIGKDQNIFTCSITGVLQNSDHGSWQNIAVYLPHEYFKEAYSHEWWVQRSHDLVIKVQPDTDPLSLGLAIENYFRSKYGNTGYFFVDSNTVMIKNMYRFINLSAIILIAVAVLSLIVGGVGIVNMMLASIQQKLKEIGVRKIVGATNFSIRIQFMLETFYICLIGGVLGIIVGILFYELVIFCTAKFFQTVQFEFFYSIPAILFSFLSLIITALVCSIIPALKAESMDIIFALKEE